MKVRVSGAGYCFRRFWAVLAQFWCTAADLRDLPDFVLTNDDDPSDSEEVDTGVDVVREVPLVNAWCICVHAGFCSDGPVCFGRPILMGQPVQFFWGGHIGNSNKLFR